MPQPFHSPLVISNGAAGKSFFCPGILLVSTIDETEWRGYFQIELTF
jgi:hypothetical protein